MKGARNCCNVVLEPLMLNVRTISGRRRSHAVLPNTNDPVSDVNFAIVDESVLNEFPDISEARASHLIGKDGPDNRH